MNNFNTIFSAIKAQCKDAGTPDNDCYESIVNLVNDIKGHLPPSFYLDVLHGMGLIRYCDAERVIIITPKGKMTEQLFA